MINLRTACLAVLAVLTGVANAEEAKTKVSGEAEAFFQHTWFKESRPAYKFEEYRAVPNGVILDKFSLDLSYVDYRMSFEALHASQLDQSYKAEGGKPGKYGYKVFADDTPHLYGTRAKTPFVDQGKGYMALPDGLQQDFETNTGRYLAVSTGMASFLAASPDVAPLRMRTEKEGLDLSFRPSENWVVGVSGQRLARSGTKPQGTALGFSNAIELAAPIDNVSYEAGVGADYLGKSYQAGLHYSLSTFNNQIEGLTWDNPKRLTDRAASLSGYVAGDQSAKGRLATDPDNLAHSLNVSAGFDLPLRSRLSAEVGYTIFDQNATLQPYTINTALVTNSTGTPTKTPFNAFDAANLPRAKAEAQMVALSQTYKLGSREVFTKDLRTTLSWREYKLKNESEEWSSPGYVRLDQVWEGIPQEAEGYHYTKKNAEAKLDYDLLSSLSVGGGYGIEWKEQLREVPKTKEDQVTGSVVYKPRRDLFVNLSGLLAKRRMDEFDIDHYKNAAGTLVEMPGLRRFDVADRDRKQGRVQLQYAGDSDLGLSVSSLVTKDKYLAGKGDLTGGVGTNQNKLYGMTSASEQAHGVDVALPLLAALSMDLYYEYDLSRRYIQSNNNASAAAAQDAATDWTARTVETSNIGGVVFHAKPAGRFSADVGYDVVNSKLETRPIAQGSSLSYKALPTTSRLLQTATFRGKCKLSENLSLIARYAFEKFNVSDFATDDVPLLSSNIPGADAIYLGNSIKDYTAHTMGLGLNYAF